MNYDPEQEFDALLDALFELGVQGVAWVQGDALHVTADGGLFMQPEEVHALLSDEIGPFDGLDLTSVEIEYGIDSDLHEQAQSWFIAMQHDDRLAKYLMDRWGGPVRILARPGRFDITEWDG